MFFNGIQFNLRNLARNRQFSQIGLRSQQGIDITQSHSVRLMNGSRPSRHRYIFKVRQSLKSAIVTEQKLSAPQIAVSPVTGAIEGHTDNRRLNIVFGHTTGNVRMVVLHSDSLQAIFGSVLKRIFGSPVFGVQVISNYFGFYPEKVFIQCNGVFEVFQRFGIVHIADVLA